MISKDAITVKLIEYKSDQITLAEMLIAIDQYSIDHLLKQNSINSECDHRYHSKSGRYMLYEGWCEKCGSDCHVV